MKVTQLLLLVKGQRGAPSGDGARGGEDSTPGGGVTSAQILTALLEGSVIDARSVAVTFGAPALTRCSPPFRLLQLLSSVPRRWLLPPDLRYMRQRLARESACTALSRKRSEQRNSSRTPLSS